MRKKTCLEKKMEEREIRKQIIRDMLQFWEFDDSLIDEVIKMEEAINLGEWYRVCLNTIVREQKSLDSNRVMILAMGGKVHVVETVGRRVRIDLVRKTDTEEQQPVDGWCSIESSMDDLILSKALTSN